MTELLDRVARAILTASMPHTDAWDMVTEDDRNRCHEYARAAAVEFAPLIERAFRDGLAYGTNVLATNPDITWRHSVVKAMIDAALSEGK